MPKARLKVVIPAEVVSKFKLESGQHLTLKIKNRDIVIQPTPRRAALFQRHMMILALVLAGMASLGFIGFFLTQQHGVIQLSGSHSIASWAIYLGTLTGTITFASFFIQNRTRSNNYFVPKVYWRNFPTIVIAFAVILVLLLLGSFWVLEHMFLGASFDLFTATLIFFIFNLLVNYFMTAMALTINVETLTNLFILVFVSGVAIAMISNGQERWWQHNLSYLGTQLAYNSWQFNLTLILSAFIMLALIDYLFVSLTINYPHSKRLGTLRVILMLVSIDLGAVGLFPNNARFHWLHDHIAMALVYWIIVLIVGIRWLLPKVSREFLWASYIVGGGLIALDIAFQVIGYLSLTAFELSAFVLAFSWIMLLLQQIKALISGLDQDYTVTVQKL